MPGRQRTARPQARLVQGRNDWYRITNSLGGGPAQVHIYDEIGYWGITAGDFVRDLGQLNATAIDLHVNSPGGEIFDGIAIANALIAHPATVTTYVDGLAASIASVIALAGDRVVMAPRSQMMIHDGSGLCIGNAAEMRAMAELLDRQSDNIAGVYAEKAGGTVAEWRALMEAETWYTAEEAVTAGLADEVYAHSLTEGNSPKNSWDLSIFRYPSRADAPPPVPVNEAVDCPAAPVVAPEPAVEPAAEVTPDAPAAIEPAEVPEPQIEPAAPVEDTAPDPWAEATAHLTTAPSSDDAFTRLTEALL